MESLNIEFMGFTQRAQRIRGVRRVFYEIEGCEIEIEIEIEIEV